MNSVANGQDRHPPIPTPVDSFIISPQIEWAAYINADIKFENINLNKLLVTRFSKDEINASLPLGSGSFTSLDISYIKKDSLDSIVAYPFICILPIYDSSGNIPFFYDRKPMKIDTASFTYNFVNQVLYIENGELRSYVPWINSSIVVVKTQQTEQFLGMGEYFSTCFNYDRNFRSTVTDSVIFLSETRNIIHTDSIQLWNRLKELYGRTAVETLWPYILGNRYKMINMRTGQAITGDNLYEALLHDPCVGEGNGIPEYDSSGNVSGYTSYNWLVPGMFTDMELVQNWYYNYDKNIVFSKIREVCLYTKQRNGYDTHHKVPTLAFKLILK